MIVVVAVILSNITDTEISFTAPSPHADTIWKVRSQIHLLEACCLES